MVTTTPRVTAPAPTARAAHSRSRCFRINARSDDSASVGIGCCNGRAIVPSRLRGAAGLPVQTSADPYCDS